MQQQEATISIKKCSKSPLPIIAHTEAMLRQEGLDEAICQHISHLFTRDPLATLANRWGRSGV